MSKGKKALQELADLGIEFDPPPSWWNMTDSVRRAVAADMVTLNETESTLFWDVVDSYFPDLITWKNSLEWTKETIVDSVSNSDNFTVEYEFFKFGFCVYFSDMNTVYRIVKAIRGRLFHGYSMEEARESILADFVELEESNYQRELPL
jgi:hypothetical protein